MAGEFTKPGSVKPAIAGQIANPDEYNQNIAAQNKDSFLVIDEDGNFIDGNLGDETIGSNGALFSNLKLRQGGLIKVYDSSGVFVENIGFTQATESVLGTAKIATQVITDTGTNDTDFVTPLKLANTLTPPTKVLVDTVVCSGQTTIDFESLLTSDYLNYEIIMTSVIPSGGGADMWAELGVGASYSTTSYVNTGLVSAPSTLSFSGGSTQNINVAPTAISSTSTKGLSGTLKIWNPSGTANHKQVSSDVFYDDGSGLYTKADKGGSYEGSTAAQTSIRFTFGSSRTFTSGTFKLYGLV